MTARMTPTITERCIGGCGRTGPVVRRHPGVEGFLCDDCRSFVTIRVIVPSAPVAALSANNRRRGNHWAQAEATTIVKQHTKAALANNPQPWQEWLDGPLHLAVRICWPCGKKGKLPDVDQLGSYVKGYVDALEGTLFVNDDQIQRVSYEQTRLDRATTDSLYPDGAVILDFSPAQGETSE